MNPTFQLPEEVTGARQRAQDITKEAQNYQAGESSISDVLRQKVQEAYSNNQDIIKPLDEATSTYLSAPQVGREMYQDVFNPFSREKLVSQYVGTEALPMLGLSNILGNRMGRIEDTIGAGTRAYQGETARKVAEAGQAQDMYSALLNEYLQTEKLRQDERQLDISEYNATKSSGGGDGYGSLIEGFSGLVSLARQLGINLELPGQPQEQTELERPPQTSIPGRTDLENEYPRGSGIFWVSDGEGGWR